MITINDQTITNMIQTLESMNISAMEHQRINTEKHVYRKYRLSMMSEKPYANKHYRYIMTIR